MAVITAFSSCFEESRAVIKNIATFNFKLLNAVGTISTTTESWNKKTPSKDEFKIKSDSIHVDDE